MQNVKDDSIEIFVPGRLCLFGEHSDWASEYRKYNKNIEKGYALVATINQGIRARVKKSKDFRFSFDDKNVTSKMSIKKLKEYEFSDEFLSCVIETAKYMLNTYKVEGIDINITEMDLPIGVGLSSSSAICVLVVKAFNKLYNLNIEIKKIMDIAYISERNANLKCGKMDHVCALGEGLVKMEFDGEITIEKIKNKNKLYFVFCIIKQKNTRKILDILNKSYPNINSENDRLIQATFGDINKEIVSKAIKYIEDGYINKLGKLMFDSQKIFDKNIAPSLGEEFEEVNLHKIIKHKDVKKLILGAKGVGSHGDGAVQFLVKNKESQDKLIETLHKLDYKAYKLDI